MRTPRHDRTSSCRKLSKIIPNIVAALAAGALMSHAGAEDWGAYALVPVSAKAMTLETVDSGAVDGTAVSIGKPAGAPNQKWVITSKRDNFFSIKPSSSSPLALSVAKGAAKNGASIVLETDAGQPWQLWSLTKNENGSYMLTPKHAPELALDDFGGGQNPGARIDLWSHQQPGDQHLQWMIKPLAGSTFAALATEAPVRSYEPPAVKPEDVRLGEIKKFTFTQSAIFPGTVREVTVFIPAQYDGRKPACVYVKTDGYNPKEKTLLETMIATREMPVTVGVFVRPGDLPPTVKGTLGRRNRDFEYDGMGDNNVRLLTEELLPYVAKELNLTLSEDGNDRCISGGSSGGIAAFTAAWERPEAFSRVYAASGSFVAFRGGHEYPTMVRKFEPRPIRAYLTTGTHDMENCAGDWFLLDQEMDKALKFSGYEYFFRIIEGGHVAGYMDYWQEAMAYLWKGWPERVQAGPGAPRARDVLLPDEKWQSVKFDGKDARGPACSPSGEVFFVDAAANKIHRIDLDGKVTEFVSDAGHANSLSFGPDGQLFAASAVTGKIMSYDAADQGRQVIDRIHCQYILATPGGELFATSNGDKLGGQGEVWFIKDGRKTLVDSGLKFATGLAYRPDQWLLAVADGRSKWAYSYQINSDGALTNKERYFDLHVRDWEDDAGAESICYAKEGQMFVATRAGIQVCADDGPTQVILPVPNRSAVMGVCLGGRDFDTLFAFCGDKIWKRKVKTHAIGAFSPWMKVSGTKL